LGSMSDPASPSGRPDIGGSGSPAPSTSRTGGAGLDISGDPSPAGGAFCDFTAYLRR
jgi:hypothetical protein